jgi:hypothetical protein
MIIPYGPNQVTRKIGGNNEESGKNKWLIATFNKSVQLRWRLA